MKKLILSLMVTAISLFGENTNFFREAGDYKGQVVNWVVCEMQAKKPYCVAGNGDLTVMKVTNALKGTGIKFEPVYDNSVDNSRLVKYSGFMTTKTDMLYRAVADLARDTVEMWEYWNEPVKIQITMDNSFDNGKFLDLKNPETFKGITAAVNGQAVNFLDMLTGGQSEDTSSDTTSTGIVGFPDYSTMFDSAFLSEPPRDNGSLLFQFQSLSSAKINITGYKICYMLDFSSIKGICFNGGGYPDLKSIEKEINKLGYNVDWLYSLDNNNWWSVEVRMDGRTKVLKSVMGYEIWDDIALKEETFSGEMKVHSNIQLN